MKDQTPAEIQAVVDAEYEYAERIGFALDNYTNDDMTARGVGDTSFPFGANL